MVGIGGVGMSGIAEMLIRLGQYEVTGSDVATGKMIKRLLKLGAKIQIGHHVDLVAKADVLVYSSAIDDDNLELIEARNNRIPILSRAEMLAELMRFKKGIAVAGTHGKTTTTSILATTLGEGNIDPTFVVGGVLNATKSNAKLGKGEYMVVEADESDASFLQLKPTISVITNIDFDHMSTYADSPEKLHQTFIDFVHHLPFYGTCIVCIDDEGVRHILPSLTRRIIRYGFAEDADYRIQGYQQQGFQGVFSVSYRGESLGQFCLNMPGKHNASNAVVSIVIANELGVAMSQIRRSLRQFPGVGRRFSLRQNCQLGKATISWLDDYAHHPTEIAATCQAIQNAWPKQRKVLVFQPHRYSRTRDLFDDFVRVLSNCQANLLIITEVYAANEPPIPTADGETLTHTLRLRGMKDVLFIAAKEELQQTLRSIVDEGDILISMGAGNLVNWVAEIVHT